IVGETWEGITFFDHPTNPRAPVSWHVRDDGWMSPAFCLREAYALRKAAPLRLRYALHVHARDVDVKAAAARYKAFASSAPCQVSATNRPCRVSLRRGER